MDSLLFKPGDVKNLPILKQNVVKDISYIFLILDKKIVNKTNRLNINDQQKFINSDIFIENIINYLFIKIQHGKKCHILCDDYNILQLCFKKIINNFANDYEIYIETRLNTILTYNVYKLKFSNPCLSSDKMLRFQYIKGTQLKNIRYQSEYMSNIYNKKIKKATFKLNTNCIKYLKKIVFKNNIKQEIGGFLYIDSTSKDLIHTLNINTKKITVGNDTDIKLNRYKIMFHSHPIIAYQICNSKYGWPSPLDIYTFLSSKKVLCHIIPSIEGIYIISKVKEDYKLPNMYKFKKQVYINKEENTINQYLKKINKIKINDESVFKITFKNWNTNIKFKIQHFDNNFYNL